jgi:hypothetical protein
MPTPSHDYQVPADRVARVCAIPLGGLVLVLALLQASARLGWLPEAVPDDLDHTILSEKVRLARTPEAASVVLLGDSSCLMNADPVELGRDLGEPVLNLGTLSYLDLPAHGALLAEFGRCHPGTPRLAVLLMHPEALWRGDAVPAYVEFLESRLAASPTARLPPSRSTWSGRLGPDLLRECVVQPCVPPLLRGAFAVEFGTTRGVVGQLRSSRGGLIDPTSFQPGEERVRAEYRLARTLEADSRRFRERIPAHTRLAVGLTPLPESVAAPGYEARARALLATWAGWLRADHALGDLPAVLPDDHFATITHLNPRGAAEYSTRLARVLSSPPAAPAGPNVRDTNPPGSGVY